MYVIQSAEDELRMQNMKADLEKAEAELQVKTAELDRLRDELNTLRHDSEVWYCSYYCSVAVTAAAAAFDFWIQKAGPQGPQMLLWFLLLLLLLVL